MIGQRSALQLLGLCAGLVVWTSAFVTLYAALSVGCAFGWEDRAFGPVSLQRGVLLAIWIAHLVAVAAILLWSRRRAAGIDRGQDGGSGAGLDGFFAQTVLWASVVALAVTVVNYAPILGLSACL